MDTLNWGIVATGFIAEQFANGLKSSDTGRLQAVASRSLESAEQFAGRHGAKRAYASVQALFEDSEVDAVYISTPHPRHAALAVQAIAAGKHVLCEKPLGMNAAETRQVVTAARDHGVTLMEAYMYRCHPQTQRIRELIADGAIGRVKLVQASFGFRAPFDPEARLFNRSLGGGAILDVGGYPLSFACLAARLTSDHGGDPAILSFEAAGELHPDTGADTLALAQLQFGNGVFAQLSVGTLANQENAVRIFGDRGSILVPHPWIIARDGGEWSFQLRRDKGDVVERVSGSDKRGLYGIEADYFAALVHGQPSAAPGMSAAESLQVNQLLERWRRALGVSYSSDSE